MADLDPIDKGKVNEVVFDLLDHLDEWYGQDAEISHLLVVARVTDASGDRYTDVVTSSGTSKDEALESLTQAYDGVRTRQGLRDSQMATQRPWWRRVFGG